MCGCAKTSTARRSALRPGADRQVRYSSHSVHGAWLRRGLDRAVQRTTGWCRCNVGGEAQRVECVWRVAALPP